MRTSKEFNNFYKKKDPWDVLKIDNTRNEIIKKIIKKYQYNKTLELGCGEGNFCKYFNKKNLKCNDISLIALKRLKKKYPMIKTIKKDMLKINFEKFDSIFAFECIYYFSQQERLQFFLKIKKFLKKNKVFIFSTPIIGNSTYRYYFTDRELKKIFKRFNINLIGEKKLNIYFPKKYKLDFFIRLVIRIIFKGMYAFKLSKYRHLILNILPQSFIYQKAYVLKKS
jgi:SAM-dependent methyltransferase